MRMDLYWIDGPWTGKLAIFAHPRGGERLLDEIRALKDNGLDVIVSLLTKEEDKEISLLEEKAMCETVGSEFMQFPIADVSVPASRTATLELVNRSEEHTSELQSQSNLVCRLLLEKKNT